jgi:hypothetical protein
VRTTLTLDDDVVAKLKAEMKKSGQPMKAVINELLRAGLVHSEKAAKEKPFKVKTRSLGLRPGLNYDSTSELLEQVEGPWHK